MLRRLSIRDFVIVTTLELDATPTYELDFDNLTIYSDDIDGLVDVLHNGGIFNFTCHRNDSEPSDGFLTDAEADAAEKVAQAQKDAFDAALEAYPRGRYAAAAEFGDRPYILTDEIGRAHV